MNPNTTPAAAGEPIKQDLSFFVFNPNTAGNYHPTDYLCVVRNGGVLWDERHHATKALAEEWGRTHNGEPSRAVASFVAQCISEKHTNDPAPENTEPLPGAPERKNTRSH